MIDKTGNKRESKVENHHDHVQESSDPVVPHERQIIDDIIVIHLWSLWCSQNYMPR